MPKKLILFDFDGVIIDSFKPAFDTHKIICPHSNEEDYRKAFEGNINDWEVPAEVHTKDCRLDIDFFAEYITRMKKETKIFPGMKEVINELEKKYILVVVSSTITSPIQEFLTAHDLINHFDWVMGNDVHQSKVEKMKMVFAKYDINSNDCVFITDTLGDMREAEKMSIGTIGITWGFHTLETLQKGNPFCLVDNPIALPRAISDFFEKH
ncbi:MAG TPA: HAD-IA family hydrolase [Candidatus Paceibacterota bacterium]